MKPLRSLWKFLFGPWPPPPPCVTCGERPSMGQAYGMGAPLFPYPQVCWVCWYKYWYRQPLPPREGRSE